ncbi:MAG: alkaline phosphatase family protein [Ktedonobacteraceae bacterium]
MNASAKTRIRATTVPASMASIKNVWFIMFENHSWSDIQGSASAPYINGTLLPQASYSTNHWDPNYGHPSLAAYIDLEAGSNLGITNDYNPGGIDEQSTTQHFVTQLQGAGLTWKGYIEGISGTTCPLTNNTTTQYAVRHNPQMYFADVTNNNSSTSQNCIAHERPLTQLQTDLKNNTVPSYSYILPTLCHDMHTQCPARTGTNDEILAGDNWLKTIIPGIMASAAYQQSGAIFISWDEGTDDPITGADSDGPIGMIVLSPFAKGGSYTSSVFTDHNSTLLSFEEIFGVAALRDATTATDLADLFQ